MDLDWGLIATVFVAALGGGGIGTAAINLFAPWAQDGANKKAETRAEQRRLEEQRRDQVKLWRAGIAQQTSLNLRAADKKYHPDMKTPFLGFDWYRELEPHLPAEMVELARAGSWMIGSVSMLEFLDSMSDEVTKKAKDWGVE